MDFIIFIFIFISLKYLIYDREGWSIPLTFDRLCCSRSATQLELGMLLLLYVFWGPCGNAYAGAYRSRWFSVIATLRPLHTLAVTTGGLERIRGLISFTRKTTALVTNYLKLDINTVKCHTGSDADWKSWYAWQPPGDLTGLRFWWLQE